VLCIDPEPRFGASYSTVRPSISIMALCLSGCMAFACGDKREAHLGKFMQTSSERPIEFGKPPDAYSLAESDEEADRIHKTTFEEVAQRLGAHRQKIKTDFRFKTNDHYTSLKEDALIVQAGNRDFRVKVDNDSSQGYELLYSGGKLYLRSRFGTFHERSILDRIHLSQRESAYQAWGAVYRLYRGRLRFTKVGLARHFGRDALNYTIGLANKPARLPGTPEQPKVPAGETKYVYPIETTPSERDRWRDKAEPVQAGGSLLIDMDTGAILKVDFSGSLGWKDDQGQVTELLIRLQLEADGFGNPPAIEPPAVEAITALPERIHVDTHPLDFIFGKGFTAGLGPAAGVARRSDTEIKADIDKPGGSQSKP
jgi:hypothetical protein